MIQENVLSPDPEKIAERLRRYMMREEGGVREYFLGMLKGSDQERDTRVLEEYFRAKDYIKMRPGSSEWTDRWLKSSSEDVWSSMFVGLDENGMQKLEFQNPPYSAAHRLGGDPREFNKVFTIQLNGCTYDCSFCFVPRAINTPELGNGIFLSAEEIVDHFMEQYKTGARVIRDSGGEVTSVVPELLLDVQEELEKRGLDGKVYHWADCNLSNLKYIKEHKDELKGLARKRNFGMVGCLKAIGDGKSGRGDFHNITGLGPEYFEKQFETLKYLVKEIKADFYLYLLPIKASEEDYMDCAKRLKKIHPNLPLRANILKIHQQYSGYAINAKRAVEGGRKPTEFDERFAWDTWYNKILPELYSSEDLKKYRCQIII